MKNRPAPTDLFGAFANPTRSCILNRLQAQMEICDRDLVEVLGEPQPKIPSHLSLLRSTGLVEVCSEEEQKSNRRPRSEA